MSWVRILRFLVSFLFTRPRAEDLRHLDLEAVGGFSFSGSRSRTGSTIFSADLSTAGDGLSDNISFTAGSQSTAKTTSSRDISSRSYGIEAVSDTTTPFWLGKDSLIAPEVKIPATLLLMEHLLLGSGPSPLDTLDLFLFAFLRDGHLGSDGNLLCH